jgi:hypothetical protein
MYPADCGSLASTAARRIPMNAAIECNNIGVALLQAGRLREALDTFKVAAQVMFPVSQYFQASPTMREAFQRSVLPVAPALQPEPTTTYPIISDGQDMVEQAKAILSLVGDAFGTVTKKDSATDNCYIWTEPLVIDLVRDSPTTCTMESAIIVYNMGLTYHLEGYMTCLEKALCLFDMSFNLALSMPSDVRSSKIVMASLNNAAQILHSLGTYQLSRQFLDTLTTYIMSLPPTSCQESLRERHQFLLNAMLLHEPGIAGAA